MAINSDPLPAARRRIIWEHAEDLAVFLYTSIVLNILFIAAVFILGLMLFSLWKRPPYVMEYPLQAQDRSSYVYYRTTEEFRLRNEMVRSFLSATACILLKITPAGFDSAGLDALVSSRVISAFRDAYFRQENTILQLQRRQLWKIQKLRRFQDPNQPSYSVIVMKGERINYENIQTYSGQADLKTTSTGTMYLVYLKPVLCTPDNPWGWLLDGIQEVANREAQDKIWEKATDLVETKNGQSK